MAMQNDMLTIQQIRKAVSKIGRQHGIKSAYLFGSYARGEANGYSDIDLMIDSGKIKGLIELSEFGMDLADELGGVKVDVVPENSLSLRFFDMVKNDRILVYGK